MKLTNIDKKILINDGYTVQDLKQIEELKYNYYLDNEKITMKQARKVLTQREFLSGIGRAAFHCTAMRNNVYIESNLLDFK